MTILPKSTDELVAFLDANIVLEGKPLAELPWTEIATAGLIRVLIVPRAMEEIDAKKRDGRLSKHARAFNRLIGLAVEKGEPIVIREADPRVELQLATCSRIPWNDYDELDPDDGDSRIVAEALNVRNVTSPNRIFLSHDIKPLAYARGRGLPVRKVSDGWLRGPEPHPKDKEVHTLKKELSELRKDEPTFEISIEISDITPPTIYRVTALDAEQAAAITALLKRQNPKKSNGSRDIYGISSGFGSGHDSSYDGKYNDFINRKVPSFVAKFSEKLQLLFNQRLLTVRVTNSGGVRADHLVVSIKTSDGWINRKLMFVPVKGPAAPVPRANYLISPNIYRHLDHIISPRVGRHEFETTLRARKSRETKAICEDFHSGQVYCFNGVAAPTSSDQPLEIIVTLTAKNLRGELTKTFKLKKQIVITKPGELVDLKTLELNQDYPTKAEFARLLRAEKYDEIDRDEKDED
jgi:hypothetical protein